MKNSQDLIRPTEAAALLNRSLKFIYELLGNGELTVIKNGCGIRVSKTECLEWSYIH